MKSWKSLDAAASMYLTLFAVEAGMCGAASNPHPLGTSGYESACRECLNEVILSYNLSWDPATGFVTEGR
jgi:hypothetical protein